MIQRSANRKTVLIIEDRATQILHLQASLEKQGFDTVLARNSGVSLQKARQICPAVIVLDVRMPEQNGVKICEVLKTLSTTRDIPVFVLVARDEQNLITCGVHLNTVDYVLKDAFANDMLLKKLAQLGLC
jgi:PleD family two-component response regulator